MPSCRSTCWNIGPPSRRTPKTQTYSLEHAPVSRTGLWMAVFGPGVQRVTFCGFGVLPRVGALLRHTATCVYTTAQTHTKIYNTKITLIYVTLSLALALVWHVLCCFFLSVRIGGRFICMCVSAAAVCLCVRRVLVTPSNNMQSNVFVS